MELSHEVFTCKFVDYFHPDTMMKGSSHKNATQLLKVISIISKGKYTLGLDNFIDCRNSFPMRLGLVNLQYFIN